jgi:GLPGLI family protein
MSVVKTSVVKKWAVLLLLMTSFRLVAQNAAENDQAARQSGDATTIFLAEGRIEFERKVNQYALMDKDNDFTELMKKSMPQFKTNYYDLVFTRNKSLYKPGRESPDNNNGFGWSLGDENTIYSDLENKKCTSQKKVFEQLFLVQDSLRNIKWKITEETKTIAGFVCRRANALIMDSIYVVAFYTDEILSSSGPESFTGLPGMILGVALPHQHVTWFATKVMAVPVKDSQIPMPLKGKKTNNRELQKTMEESMIKNWGKNGHRLMETVLL